VIVRPAAHFFPLFCFYGTDPRPEPFSQWAITLVDLMGSWVSYERERQHREAELTRERNRLEEFASVVSHDLRNPLNIASSHLELARDEHDGEHLAGVADTLDRMDALIEDVLALARMGGQVVDEEPIEFSPLVRAAWSTVSEPDSDLVVDGDGPGIPEDERDSVFDRGYTTADGGTGFGLSIVVEIVSAHGGDIAVTESESGGARFEITGFDVR
jgi:signal transduction histidine kinase